MNYILIGRQDGEREAQEKLGPAFTKKKSIMRESEQGV